MKYEYQIEEISVFTKILNFKTNDINTDAHPLYQNNNKLYKKIYHHHAHAISVIAEHGLLGEKALAVVCDGTGYGVDGNIWGFEFLDINSDYRKFDRAAHLKYFYLPGGEKSVVEIDRIANSLMQGDFETSINCPKTSSLGRLFDGVASICGLLHKVGYEAQGAILLQKHAENFNRTRFKNPKYRVLWRADELDFDPMILGMQDDLKDKVSVEEIAYKFHVWVVDSIIEFIKGRTTEEILIFSGGCFQNALLCKLLKQKLLDNGFKKVYFNNMVPTNDGAISFGQAMF
jgi:hydrogenase maturation protein HypF